MEYLKLFESTTLYDNYSNGVMHLPNVSYNEDTKKVMFNPKPKRILKYNATDDNLLCFSPSINLKSVRIDGGENIIKEKNYLSSKTFTVTKDDYLEYDDDIIPINASKILLADCTLSYYDSVKLTCNEPILDSYNIFLSRYITYYGAAWETIAFTLSNPDGVTVTRLSETEIIINIPRHYNTTNHRQDDWILYECFCISKTKSITDIIPTTVNVSGILHDLSTSFSVFPSELSIDNTNQIYSYIPKFFSPRPMNITVTTPNHALSTDDIIAACLSIDGQQIIEPVMSLGASYGKNVFFINENSAYVETLVSFAIQFSELPFESLFIMDENLIPLETHIQLHYYHSIPDTIYFETSGEHEVVFETHMPTVLDYDIFGWNNKARLTHVNYGALNYVNCIPDSILRSEVLQELAISSSIREIYPNDRLSKQLVKIVVDKNNPVYDSRDNCNAIIKTSTNKLIMASNSTTTIPPSVASLGDYAFSYCQIDEITIPSGITSLGNGTFFASAISKITFEENSQVTKIPNNCFSNCKNLSEFIIPNHITELGANILGYTNCQKIICESTTPPTYHMSTFSGLPETGTLYVPKGSDYSAWLDDYALGSGWTIVEMEN